MRDLATLIKYTWHCLLLASLLSLARAEIIAYVAKTAPGDTSSAGAGKQWPNHRFNVGGDCVIDNLTGLIWARNGSIGFYENDSRSNLATQPNYANDNFVLSRLSWYLLQVAFTKLNAAPIALCGYRDWRLPNINELASLINYAAGSNNSNPGDWLTAQGFINLWTDYYWSATPYSSDQGFRIFFYDGTITPWEGDAFVLPVRGGK